MDEPRSPIGVFDSGVGGLTVVRELAARLPHESIVYLGDTARVPYGTKSRDTVIRYARACTRQLLDRDAKMVVVACNTATAQALEVLRDELPIPVVGVVEPGARRAVAASRTKRIGVIGTAGTIGSGAYQSVIAGLDRDASIFVQACPLFVPLAEEGWLEGEVPEAAARTYLAPLLAAEIDTLVLGCTHYPLLRDVIGAAAGPEVTLVDSAEATADAVADLCAAMGGHDATGDPVRHTYLVTDAPESFFALGRRFLGYDLERVEWVDI